MANSSNIIQLYDRNNTDSSTLFYPITTTEAVVDHNGKNLDTVLSEQVNNDYLNVNQMHNSTVPYQNQAAARSDVSTGFRERGLSITYLLGDSSTWISEQFVGGSVDSGWTDSSNWQPLGPVSVINQMITVGNKPVTGVVSVTQNTETGKKELLIGGTPALIVDNEPEKNSDNLVKSGGVFNKINDLEIIIDGKHYLSGTNTEYVVRNSGLLEIIEGFGSNKYDITPYLNKTIHIKTPLSSNPYVAVFGLFNYDEGTGHSSVAPITLTSVSSEVDLDLSLYPDAKSLYVSYEDSDKNTEVEYTTGSLVERIEKNEEDISDIKEELNTLDSDVESLTNEVNSLDKQINGEQIKIDLTGTPIASITVRNNGILQSTEGFGCKKYSVSELLDKIIHIKTPLSGNRYVAVFGLYAFDDGFNHSTIAPITLTSESNEIDLDLSLYPTAKSLYVSYEDGDDNVEVSYLESSDSLEEKISKKIETFGYSHHINTLSSSGSFEGDIDAVCGNKQLSMIANVDGTFNSVTFGQGKLNYAGLYVVVDTTNIEIYVRTSSATNVLTEAHGLTFTNTIGIFININRNNSLNVKVIGDSGNYTTQNIIALASNGKIFLETLTDLKDVYISHSSRNYKSKVWFIGDSYISTIDNSRWGYHLINTYDINSMILGFPGSDAEDMYNRFISALQYGTPNVAVWCIGMNNPDNGVINASWKEYTDKFIEVCQSKGIDYILELIPNAKGAQPDYSEKLDNSYKDAYIRSLGCKYIDVPTLVGADANGDWKAGWLSSDGVHPTIISAPVIAMFMIMNVPQCVDD